ncbi:hypothetical protein K440DRAFT_626803 [Wilcoxina mikolae CBS 423.85]|nr:hypothetical protein K440DRAFT_626803 [Wilcoxina mikolae CBS 423.85]
MALGGWDDSEGGWDKKRWGGFGHTAGVLCFVESLFVFLGILDDVMLSLFLF